MKNGLSKSFVISAAITLVLIQILIFILRHEVLIHFERNMALQDHSYEILHLSNQILFSIDSVEETQTDFSKTEDNKSLIRPPDGIKRIYLLLNHLKAVTVDNPSQQKQIAALQDQVNTYFSLPDKEIPAPPVNPLNTSGEPSIIAAGGYLPGRIHSTLSKLVNEEERLRKGRNLTLKINRLGTSALLLTGTLVIFGMLLFLFVLLLRENKEKKSIGKELSKSQENYSKTMLNMEDGVISTDLLGQVLFMNPASEKLTGWSLSEVKGKPIETVLDTSDELSGRSAISTIKIALQENKVVPTGPHTVLIRKDKSQLFIDDSAAPIHDHKGDVIGAILVFRNISEKKLAEDTLIQINQDLESKVTERTKELMKNELHYKQTLDGMLEGIQIIDFNWCYLYVNEAMALQERKTRDELIGRSIMEKYPDLKHSDTFEAMKTCMEQRTSGQIEKEMSYPDQSRAWFKLIIQPVPQGIFIISSDITEQKRYEEKIIKVSRLYFVISQINQMIVRTTDEQTLFKKACAIAVDIGKFKMAWVGMIQEQNHKVIPVVYSGDDHDYFSEIKTITLDDVPEGRGPTGTAIREGRYCVCNDMENDPRMAPWKAEAAKRGYRSSIALPIMKSGSVAGAISLYASETHFFDDQEIKLLLEVTEDISFALDLFVKDEKHKKAEKAALESEAQYHSLFDNMLDGFALCKMDYENGVPVDFTYLGVNNAFEKLTGLKNVKGKKVSGVIPKIKEDNPELFETFDKVAQSGQSEKFETYIKSMEMWLNISVYSNRKEYFIAVFDVITERKVMEQEREFDRNNLNALINNTADLMWSVDRNFNLITANTPFDEICTRNFGHSIKKGENVLLPAYTPKMSQHFEQLYERAFQGQSFMETEHFDFPKESWTEISYYPIRVHGEIIGTACHSREITYQKKAELKLGESEAFNRGILNSLSSHIAVVNASGQIIAVNKPWENFALDNGETTLDRTGVGSNYFQVCEKSARSGNKTAAEALQGMLEVLNETKSNFYLEYPCHSRTEKRWFGLRVIKFDSEVQMIVAAHQDITDRKRAEETLQLTQFTFDHAGDAIYWMRADGRIVNANEAASQALGYSHQELLELSVPDIDPHYNKKGWSTFFNEIRQKGSLSFESTQKSRHGGLIPVDIRASFIKFGPEELCCAFVRDIRDRKHAERVREKISEDIIQRNKNLEQFSYIVSHNLRAPVANIIGISDAAQDETISFDLKKELMKGLSYSANKLDEVINDLNNILQSRQDVNQNAELVSFSGIMHDIQASIGYLIKKENAVLLTDFSAADEMLTIKSYLYSIFYNLISNSLKYRQPEVPVVIDIQSRRKGGNIELFFKDNGMGIDMNKKGDQVFGLYKRFHTESAEGKGMGLYMVKTQVESIGGKISISSEVNKGTTFKLIFAT